MFHHVMEVEVEARCKVLTVVAAMCISVYSGILQTEEAVHNSIRSGEMISERWGDGVMVG